MEKSHKLHRNKNGSLSLQHVLSGEVMHSSIGPKEEASLLYIDQSELKRRLEIATSEPLVLFDIGLGAGTNALAAIQVQRSLLKVCRPFHIVSFENDLSSLETAFENKTDFPFFEGMDTAVAQLLERKVWQDFDLQLQWQVLDSDFDALDLSVLPRPELIFFDFYSPKTSPHLWRSEVFKKLKDHSLPSTELFTYSAATRIRVSMLLAGFYVGFGKSTGAKTDTTVAACLASQLKAPLDQRWFEKFTRSEKKYPFGWGEHQEKELLEAIARHPQFQK